MASERPHLEEETLRIAREWLAGWRPGEAEVSDVRLEGEHPDTDLIVLFTDKSRPGCQFGFRMPLSATSLYEDGSIDDPESAVGVAMANLDEDIGAVGYGLPSNCRPGEVVWLGRRRIEQELELAIGPVLDDYAGRLEGNEIRLRDELVEATSRIAEQHLGEWQKRWSDALRAASPQRQKDGPATPLDR
ncbi:MAG TPA: hypothetical protein VEX15_13810 [Nocardioidaceae bacterium]|nr:hypothetical protein [Nocardioidaceae bacterium]